MKTIWLIIRLDSSALSDPSSQLRSKIPNIPPRWGKERVLTCVDFVFVIFCDLEHALKDPFLILFVGFRCPP